MSHEDLKCYCDFFQKDRGFIEYYGKKAIELYINLVTANAKPQNNAILYKNAANIFLTLMLHRPQRKPLSQAEHHLCRLLTAERSPLVNHLKFRVMHLHHYANDHRNNVVLAESSRVKFETGLAQQIPQVNALFSEDTDLIKAALANLNSLIDQSTKRPSSLNLLRQYRDKLIFLQHLILVEHKEFYLHRHAFLEVMQQCRALHHNQEVTKLPGAYFLLLEYELLFINFYTLDQHPMLNRDLLIRSLRNYLNICNHIDPNSNDAKSEWFRVDHKRVCQLLAQQLVQKISLEPPSQEERRHILLLRDLEISQAVQLSAPPRLIVEGHKLLCQTIVEQAQALLEYAERHNSRHILVGKLSLLWLDAKLTLIANNIEQYKNDRRTFSQVDKYWQNAHKHTDRFAGFSAISADLRAIKRNCRIPLLDEKELKRRRTADEDREDRDTRQTKHQRFRLYDRRSGGHQYSVSEARAPVRTVWDDRQARERAYSQAAEAAAVGREHESADRRRRKRPHHDGHKHSVAHKKPRIWSRKKDSAADARASTSRYSGPVILS